MITSEDIQRLIGADTSVIGEGGTRIGTMGEIFLDTVTGEPAWVTVHTGLFGRAESFVPLTDAVTRGDEIHVPYGKDVVKHAPRVEADGRLSPQEERDLYRHYGLVHDEEPDAAHRDDRDPRDPAANEAGTSGMRYAGPVPSAGPVPPAGDVAAAGAVPVELAPGGTDDRPEPDVVGHPAGEPARATPADDSMVRSEERLRVVGTERVPTERVRMRRYTVTEQKAVTVPVSREEFRLEYEPAEPGATAEVVREGEPLPAGGAEPGAPRRTGPGSDAR